MENRFNTTRDARNLFLYFAAFYIVWIIRVIYIGPHFIERFINNPLVYAILNEGMRITVWIIPVILFLRYIDFKKPVSFLKLDKDVARKILIGVLISVVFLIWVILRDYCIMHRQINFNIGIGKWMTVLVVGFAEEILFRGFLLQKVEAAKGFWKANFISAFMFMLAHFPSYIYHANNNMIIEGINIFVMGVIFGYILKRTRSLWPGIVSHSIYDLVCFMA